MKQEERILKSFKTLLANCVDKIGFPKEPTIKQLYKAQADIAKFEQYLKSKNP